MSVFAQVDVAQNDLLGKWTANKLVAFGSTTEMDDNYYVTYEFSNDGNLTQSEYDDGKVTTNVYKYWVKDQRLQMNNGFLDVDLEVLEKSPESLVIKGPHATLYFEK
ncbi:lipocalin family protein [Arenicella xantha]|uniref:Lipocalin-like domain-containing protein n=1 Tax=Arenicella xantha TaxID=644221 RepID=A0A395JH08_9GAMM|nr:lipocalin family protein [Arenicella xantha]RBP48819.1 hypothetical protein DFR28_105158 [Arenicella xantha]